LNQADDDKPPPALPPERGGDGPLILAVVAIAMALLVMAKLAEMAWT
jgi:hypothetical protein